MVVVEGTQSKGIKIKWMDGVLVEIRMEREHHELMQGMNYLKGQAEEVTRQLDSNQYKI